MVDLSLRAASTRSVNLPTSHPIDQPTYQLHSCDRSICLLPARLTNLHISCIHATDQSAY